MLPLLPCCQGNALFDFSGTGPEVAGNCNAPRAVTLSALIYCLRCLVGHDVPLNQVHPPHTLTLTLTSLHPHTHTLTLTSLHPHTHTLTLTLTSVHPHTHTLTLTLTSLHPHTHTLTLTLTLLHPHTLTPSHPHTHILTPSHSHPHTHIHTLTPSHSHTLISSHSHSLASSHCHNVSLHRVILTRLQYNYDVSVRIITSIIITSLGLVLRTVCHSLNFTLSRFSRAPSLTGSVSHAVTS